MIQPISRIFLGSNDRPQNSLQRAVQRKFCRSYRYVKCTFAHEFFRTPHLPATHNVFSATMKKVVDCSDKDTLTLKIACLSAVHNVMKMSPGFILLSGIKFSTTGVIIAAEKTATIRSLILSCFATPSTRTWHVTT